MRKLLKISFIIFCTTPLFGCGGAPETSQEANEEMQELESNPDYEAEMMGTKK